MILLLLLILIIIIIDNKENFWYFSYEKNKCYESNNIEQDKLSNQLKLPYNSKTLCEKQNNSCQFIDNYKSCNKITNCGWCYNRNTHKGKCIAVSGGVPLTQPHKCWHALDRLNKYPIFM